MSGRRIFILTEEDLHPCMFSWSGSGRVRRPSPAARVVTLVVTLVTPV